MVNLYADVAEQEGYQAGPENFGYLQNVVVAETEEKAEELGRGFVFGGGFGSFARPEWMFPPGYNSKAATQRLARALTDPRTGTEIVRQTAGNTNVEEVLASIDENYQNSKEAGLIIAGTPKTVIAKIRRMLETLRPGIFATWYHHGPMSFEDRKTCLRLLGEEVLPAMREMAKEFDLPGPFEKHARPCGRCRPPANATRSCPISRPPKARPGVCTADTGQQPVIHQRPWPKILATVVLHSCPEESPSRAYLFGVFGASFIRILRARRQQRRKHHAHYVLLGTGIY